jgi:selenide,water dikinase
MGPEALAQVLRPLAQIFDPKAYPDLILGLEPPDDAAVWRLDGERALVLSSDFFPPVVDEPAAFGAIAAANALSDVYAMGAEPLFAINLVGWPDDVDRAILSEILRGGAEKVREAGAVIAGGHTTSDKEPKYGLAAIGMGHPDRLLTKHGARPGDLLFLTKPIGTGVVTTAHKNDAVQPDHLEEAVRSMSRLNRAGASILRPAGGIHAATDVTGFSLAGHAHEMATQSGLALRFEWSAVPLLPGAKGYAENGQRPGGSKRNEAYYGPHVAARAPLTPADEALLYDPQTSGGLLFAVAPDDADAVVQRFDAAGEPLWRIGEATDGTPGTIEIV